MKSGYLGDLKLPVDLRFIAKSTGVHHTATMLCSKRSDVPGRPGVFIFGVVHGLVQGHDQAQIWFPPVVAVEQRADGYWHVSVVERRQVVRRNPLVGWLPN